MKNKNYEAICTVYGLGKMMRSKRMKIASWLRELANDIQENGRDYTDTRFTARYMKR